MNRKKLTKAVMMIFGLQSFDNKNQRFNPLSPHDALKQTEGFRTKISMKLVHQYMAIFFLIFKPHQIIFMHYKSRIATAIRGL